MPAVVPIHRLRGTILGLVGFGRIPQLVAPKAQAFGMRVLAYDPYIPPAVLEKKLEILGRLMMVSKQLDMVMLDDDAADRYYQEFITGGYNLERE
jgi:D-3-phosphoglycerate dehydrogenase